jgi:hypothetical protein
MSLPIHVEAYSGYKANERPLSFSLDIAIDENGCVTNVYDIDAVEDRWYDPNAEYFKIRTPEGKRYLLRYDQRDDLWTLQTHSMVRSCSQGPVSRSYLLGRKRLERPRRSLQAVSNAVRTMQNYPLTGSWQMFSGSMARLISS